MASLMRKDVGNVLNFAKQSLSHLFSKQNYCWNPTGEEEFRTLQLKPPKVKHVQRVVRKSRIATPREEQMEFDQDWVSAWPAQRSFHPASVPLPVRQGILTGPPKTNYRRLKEPPPPKYGNLELMKIANFLHLTPPAIARHCAALKRFCTEWPKGLETDEKIQNHFPIEISTSDYLHSSPTIRDPLARVVTLSVKLSVLPLDEHARDKFIRLVGDRYNEKTDVITIVTDRCPLRQQNTDYAQYLLTALFFEAWKMEDWESEKTEADMEKYVWDGSKAQRAMSVLASWSKDNPVSPDEVDPIPDSQLDESQAGYKKTVEEFRNIAESDESLQKYKEAAEKLLLGYSPEIEQLRRQGAA